MIWRWAKGRGEGASCTPRQLRVNLTERKSITGVSSTTIPTSSVIQMPFSLAPKLEQPRHDRCIIATYPVKIIQNPIRVSGFTRHGCLIMTARGTLGSWIFRVRRRLSGSVWVAWMRQFLRLTVGSVVHLLLVPVALICLVTSSSKRR